MHAIKHNRGHVNVLKMRLPSGTVITLLHVYSAYWPTACLSRFLRDRGGVIQLLPAVLTGYLILGVLYYRSISEDGSTGHHRVKTTKARVRFQFLLDIWVFCGIMVVSNFRLCVSAVGFPSLCILLILLSAGYVKWAYHISGRSAEDLQDKQR